MPKAYGGGFFAGASVGAGAVQNVAGVFGGEVGFTVTDSLDVIGEGLWFQDVVTRRRIDNAATVAAYLQTSQGKTATGSVKAPASYGGVGARFMLMKTGMYRPYVAFSVGGAHIAYQPEFTLGGTDITASLPQYGVALGSDITGEVTKVAMSGGGGVKIDIGHVYVDAGVRVTSIRTPDQPTNVLRVGGTVGYKF